VALDGCADTLADGEAEADGDAVGETPGVVDAPGAGFPPVPHAARTTAMAMATGAAGRRDIGASVPGPADEARRASG
jgi:hypothetical protein